MLVVNYICLILSPDYKVYHITTTMKKKNNNNISLTWIGGEQEIDRRIVARDPIRGSEGS